MNKLYAKVFYWLFLKKTTVEMYRYRGDERWPTKKGEDFYAVYHHLNSSQLQ